MRSARQLRDVEQRVVAGFGDGAAVPPLVAEAGGALGVFLAYFQAYKTGQLIEATLSTAPGATVIEAQGIVRGESGASSVELNHVDVRPRLAIGDPVRIVALGPTGYQILDAFYLTDEIVGAASESGGSGI